MRFLFLLTIYNISQNIAPKDVDLSHPNFYRKQKGGRISTKHAKETVHKDDVGQPGCTNNERKRFEKILEAGNLVDAYRELVGNEMCSEFTWRGRNSGKFGGKGMRIDHCIVSRALFPMIESVHISGHGSERIGFLGSDHCPLVITCGGGEEKIDEGAGEKKDT